MGDARQHRDKAKRCLEIARHMSDALAVNLLRQTAAEHLSRAQELENQARTGTSSPITREPQQRSEDYSDSFYYRAVRNGVARTLQSVPTEPVPEGMLETLRALDDEIAQPTPDHLAAGMAEGGYSTGNAVRDGEE
jgi:hypothetical protein